MGLIAVDATGDSEAIAVSCSECAVSNELTRRVRRSKSTATWSRSLHPIHSSSLLPLRLNQPWDDMDSTTLCEVRSLSPRLSRLGSHLVPASFTHAEKEMLKSGTKKVHLARLLFIELLTDGMGTQERLGRDAMRNYNACSLCLARAREPRACPEGHVFCQVSSTT
jgi:hypothetical protein